MDADRQDHVRLRGFLWAILVSGTVASMAGNVARALAHLPADQARGPILAAAIPPLALLSLTHVIGMWSRVTARGFVYWCFLLAIGCINAAAFRLSFDALRTLAMQYGYSHADAALFPLILDGLVAVCTLGLVVLSRIEHPGEPDAPAIQTGSPASTPAVEPDRDDVTVDSPADVAVPADDPAPDAAHEPEPVRAEASPTAAPTAGRYAAEVFHTSAAQRAGAPPAPSVNTDTDVHLERARQLVDAGRTSSPVHVVHRVLSHTAEGQSSRDVATLVGVSPSSVQRIVKASRETTELGQR